MHDIIFENQQELDLESLSLYAKTIGLDLERFKNDIQKKKLTTKVEQDLKSVSEAG